MTPRLDVHVQLPPAAATAAESADAKLGRDTVVLAMGELFGVVDAFVITSTTVSLPSLASADSAAVAAAGGSWTWTSNRGVNGARPGSLP